MKKYLFLFRGGNMGGLSPEELQKNMEAWTIWLKGLAAKGVFVAGEPLEKEAQVVTGKKKVVTDGPFAESKELVSGYLVVNAESLSEATEIAKGCPIHDTGGSTEVREIRPLNM